MDGETPIEDPSGLIPSHVTTKAELDELEHLNIQEAQIWGWKRKRRIDDLLTLDFVRALHQRMLQDVWEWAGTFRSHEVPVGVAPELIQERLQVALDDARYWIQNNTYRTDEIAARLHHRLTLIHPFPNGNGRFARFLTDLLLRSLGRPEFTWGGGDLRSKESEVRKRYLAALRAADKHDLEPLFAFLS